MKQLVKGFVLVTFIVIGGSLTEKKCLAAEGMKDSLDLNTIQYTNNGGILSLENKKDGSMKVTFSTKGEVNGYYTTSLISDQAVNVEKKAAIAIHLDTNDAISMNVNLMTKEFQTLACKEGTSVYMKADAERNYELLSVVNGVFEVKKGFLGTIYIPLASVGSKKELKEVNHFGAIMIQEQERETSVTLDSVTLLSAQALPEQSLKYSYQVMGNKSPMIPGYGEHRYEYQIIDCEDETKHIPYTFSLAHEKEGVMVSKNGTVTFLENAKPEEVTLSITIDQSFSVLYTIKPDYSWFMKQEEESVRDFIVPQPYEVASYRSHEYASFDSLISMVLVTAWLLYLVFYSKKIRKG